MESDSSLENIAAVAAQAERARERHRVRTRERRQAMSVEDQEEEGARRRRNYQIRRSRIANGATRRRQNTFSSQLSAELGVGVGSTNRLARSIAIPINVERIQENQTHTLSSTLPTSTYAASHVFPPPIGRSRLTPLNYTSVDSNMASINHGEGSTSFAASSRRESLPREENLNDDVDTSTDDGSDPEERRRTRGHRSVQSNSYHNCARDFHEGQQNPRFQLPTPKICHHCRAKLFQGETRNFCCNGGKITLLEIPAPVELLNLFTDQSAEGRIFRQNIRALNHVFSFTSIGVKLDESLATGRQGIYTFRAHGSIYHRIGTLLPLYGTRPRYMQMFIYDTEHEIENRLLESDGLNQELVEKIRSILDRHNPFVQTLRQLAQRSDIQNCRLLIRERPISHNQYTLPTASQVAAVIVGGDEVAEATNRDIIVQTIGGQLMSIKEFSGYYDPLQYPLLLPYGTYGWDSNCRTVDGTRVTCCDYYAYMLQVRIGNPSILLFGGRLLQQYAVDNYVKIETQKLRFIRSHQQEIRAELYKGLQDCLNAGEDDAGNVGCRTILPSLFIGSPHDMYQRYQDAMALVQKYGKPDLFITMTCNPSWEEIQNELQPGQTPQDRPDLLTRVFRAKFEELKKDIYTRGVLGKVVAHVHVIEFQKRGLPHAHMLIILDEGDKLKSPDAYDHIVRAEIPSKEEEPMLYEAVLRHMIHGPCGEMNRNAPCMRNRTCKKNYPKPFASCTIQGNDSYPVYRRRNDDRYVALDRDGDLMVDNGWVVPYNPWLLLKYDCHINVEICSSIKSIKYLYKYVYKGPDCVVFEVRPGPNYDEVSQYVDGRWICAPEALWKIFKFSMNKIYPSVVRLQIHLPNMQQVQFYSSQRISDERNSRTMLTEFFRVYEEGREPIQYLYSEFPRYYRWMAKEKVWRKRRSQQKVIGRLYSVSPNEGERFYLRLLLNHVRGPKSFDDLLTVDNVHYMTFKQAAEKRGLLEEDDSIRQCLVEARNIRMPSALRRLFVTILVYCQPTGVRRLWDENYAYMIEDYPSSSTGNHLIVQNRLLRDINNILLQHKSSLNDFDLPQIGEGFEDLNTASSLIEDELTIPVVEDDLIAATNLNSGQREAFNTIKNAILQKHSAVFFIDGPGGTGKTFLYRALLANLCSDGHIMLATATSGIAGNQLPGGRTAHSKLKIPIKLAFNSMCNFSKQSEISELISRASAIIWDEAPMADKRPFETVDRTLREMIGVNLPFGGKIMILGGDFRQVVPVVVGGTRSQAVKESIVESYLWTEVKVLHLTENIRAFNDLIFSDFLLRVGNGEEPTVEENMIRMPSSMAIPWEGEHSIDSLVQAIFPDLGSHTYDPEYMMDRALITPRNDEVNKLNEKVIETFLGEEQVTYSSFDFVPNDTSNLYQLEFLNSLSPGNLPPHKLTLKKGAPIMLLRNIDPKIGLCNGTRLICRRFGRNVIDAEVLTGQFKGTSVFLPRIPLKTSEDAKMPFEMVRKQFPVRLSFALTINKSQGQTIPNVGIYLPDHVFSHGQLYVALSRGVSERSTKVLVKKGNINGAEGIYTKNVVFPEIFARLRSSRN